MLTKSQEDKSAGLEGEGLGGGGEGVGGALVKGLEGF